MKGNGNTNACPVISYNFSTERKKTIRSQAHLAPLVCFQFRFGSDGGSFFREKLSASAFGIQSVFYTGAFGARKVHKKFLTASSLEISQHAGRSRFAHCLLDSLTCFPNFQAANFQKKTSAPKAESCTLVGNFPTLIANFECKVQQCTYFRIFKQRAASGWLLRRPAARFGDRCIAPAVRVLFC